MSGHNHNAGPDAPPPCPAFDPRQLGQDRRLRFYFRYALQAADFRAVKKAGRIVGCFTAKPLYGQVTPEGRVDRTRGFDGRLAIIFVPRQARSPAKARLLFARIPARCVLRPQGRRNWPLIRRAAEAAVLRSIRDPRSAARRGKSAGPAP